MLPTISQRVALLAFFFMAALLVLIASPFASAQAAANPPGMPAPGKVMLGVAGSALNPTQFGTLTGAPHEIHLVSANWNESRPWDYALRTHFRRAKAGGYRIMIHIGPHANDGRERRSPGAVARGEADRYLLDLGREVNKVDQFVYVRPPAEMNGHWSVWSAFNKSGTARNAEHSTRMYRKAFIRIALIVRGGKVSTINQNLRANGMPALRTSATDIPSSGKVALVFNPQAEGSPNVRGNMPADYYPGRGYVDYVANDLYAQSGRAHWVAHEALYNRYQAVHPFMVAEYAPWGYDDPAFVKRMFQWTLSHPRTVALIYYNGTEGNTFRLSVKSRSLATYRAAVRDRRFHCSAFTAFIVTC